MTLSQKVVSIFTAVLLITTITACGSEDSVSSISPDTIAQLQQAYADGTITVDYDSAESFESALNDGADTTNKIVSFEATEVAPDSAVGFNVMAGEHLNFKSKDAKEISDHEQVTVIVTNAKSKIGSWFIDYELIGTKDLDISEEAPTLEASSEATDATETDEVQIVDTLESNDVETKSTPENSSTDGESSSQAEVVQSSNAASTDTQAPSTDTKSDTSDTSVAVLPVPDVETKSSSGNNAGNADNFDTYDNPEQQQTEATYVLNTSTMKFHYPSCKSVKKISPDNYATSSASRDELISQGYDPCGNCKP